MRDKGETKLSKKLLIIAIATFCLAVLVPSIACVFSQTEQSSSQYVSPESMQTYAQTVISTYNQYASQYFPSIAENFSFYSTSHYNITSYISYNGAAIWFESSDIQSFKNTNLANRIESIFGGDFSLYPAFSLPANTHDVSIRGGSFELNNHPFLELGDNATVLLQDILVIQPNFAQSYTCVIMKGSNETSQWTQDKAIADAGTILYTDAGDSFSTSEAVREYYAEPVLTALLKSIQNKLANDTNYTASEWLADLQNVENVATNTYHLTNANAFINGIIAFLNAKATGILPTLPTPTPAPTPKPTQTRTIFGISDPANWIYTFLFGFYLVFLYIFSSFLRAIQKKHPNEDLKFMTSEILLDALLITIGLGFFVLNYPYASPLAIPQILLVALISISGFLSGHFAKKKLDAWRLTRANNANSADKKTQEKTNNTKKPSKK